MGFETGQIYTTEVAPLTPAKMGFVLFIIFFLFSGLQKKWPWYILAQGDAHTSAATCSRTEKCWMQDTIL